MSSRRPGDPSSGDRERTRTVSVGDGRQLAYAEYGDPDGTPVLFFHGTPGSRLLGGLFEHAARRHGICLLSLDRPGYGRSSPWPGRTLSDTGTFVTAVLDDAGMSDARVVGFSGGGAYALAFAATHGDRVSEIDVISGATPPSFRSSTPAVQRLLGAIGQRTPRALGGLFRLQAWLAGWAPPSVVVSQYTTADGRAEVSEKEAELVAHDFVEAFAKHRTGAVTESRLFTAEWDVSIAEIEHRVRLWHGERDTNVPIDAARELHDRLPNSRLTVLEGADHLTALLRSRTRVCEM
ncbi:alpha/beta hydrolase [Halobacteria archaeon AArc-xg1-1]|uniref:Alpha/beta hydrolase n=1 Tax=Natronoglomus mannanivorans TaxID=2979990 RepID=A0AAP3E3K3_9EURY|nr:alpha/beta hydrolase [Halobacteria archaeon AArc-xg1-1]